MAKKQRAELVERIASINVLQATVNLIQAQLAAIQAENAALLASETDERITALRDRVIVQSSAKD